MNDDHKGTVYLNLLKLELVSIKLIAPSVSKVIIFQGFPYIFLGFYSVGTLISCLGFYSIGALISCLGFYSVGTLISCLGFYSIGALISC